MRRRLARWLARRARFAGFFAAGFRAGGRPSACAAWSSAVWAICSTAARTDGRSGFATGAFFAAGAVAFLAAGFAAGLFAAGVFSLRLVAMILLRSRLSAPDGPAVSCGRHTRVVGRPVAHRPEVPAVATVGSMAVRVRGWDD